jgi:uncharacterized protein (UPF0335 family)
MPQEEPLISVEATSEEWQAINQEISSRRRQCKQMRYDSKQVRLLARFQQRLEQQTGQIAEDRYLLDL